MQVRLIIEGAFFSLVRYGHDMKLESLKMNRPSSKKQLNNKKGSKIKGKSTKIAAAFMQNKPNSPNVQMNVTNLITMNYAIWASLTIVKNKPNQTQYKANSNPIVVNAIIGLSSFMTSKYVRLGTLLGKKQTQFKPNQTQSSLSSNIEVGYPISKAGKRTKEAKKKKRASGTFLHLWVAGKIDFLDGCDIILEKIYVKTQFNFLWRIIS